MRWILLLLGLILLMGTASATDYYVATTGDNGYDGNVTHPWKTITYAATQAQAGDTVHIKGGNYGQEYVVVSNSGTSENPIIFQGYDGTPILDGQDETGNGWSIYNKNYTTVDNINISNYYNGIVLYGKYITLSNNVLIENDNAGIRLCCVTSQNITFDSNEFYDYDNGLPNQQDYGIQVYRTDNLTIINNYFYGEGHQDISVKARITNAYIANNTFEGFYYTAIFLGQNDGGIRANNIIVENNIFRSVSGYRAHDAIALRFVDDVIVRNNFMDGLDHSGINIYGWDDDELPIVPTPQNAEIYENIIINTIGTRPAAAIQIVGAFNNWTIYNNVFFNNTAGLYILNASGTGNVLKNNIISQTDYQVYWQYSYPGSVFFSHDYNNWFPSWTYAGANSISTDPLFYNKSNHDFYLNSTKGTWNGTAWEIMGANSLCIDAGDPTDDYSLEPSPNGNRINMGAYGNTEYASKSPGWVTFISPTLANNSVTSNNYVEVNASIFSSSLTEFIWNWNGTNYTFLNSSYVLQMDFENNSAIGENSTFAVDVSQQGNNGSFTGNWTSDGAIKLNGINEYVDISTPLITGSQDRAIIAWVKTSTHTRDIVSWGSDVAGQESRLALNADGKFFFGVDSGHALFTSVVTDNKINCVGVVLNGTMTDNVTGYFNGDEDARSALNSGTINTANANGAIGRKDSTGDRYFKDDIYKVLIIKGSPSAEEMKQIYLSNLEKYNSTHWYFESNQTGLSDGEYNYQIFANNIESDYRVITVGTSTIIIPANSYGMFNNWTTATTFSAIAANESNDVCYSYYNVTTGEWDSHYVGYSWNSDYVILLEASVMMFVDTQTTVTADIVTPSNTSMYEGWNMVFVEGTSNRTISEIIIDMEASL